MLALLFLACFTLGFLLTYRGSGPLVTMHTIVDTSAPQASELNAGADLERTR